jgi:hypothetical protein
MILFGAAGRNSAVSAAWWYGLVAPESAGHVERQPILLWPVGVFGNPILIVLDIRGHAAPAG